MGSGLEEQKPGPIAARACGSWSTVRRIPSLWDVSLALDGQEFHPREDYVITLGAAELGGRRDGDLECTPQHDDEGKGASDSAVFVADAEGGPDGFDRGTRTSRRLATVEAPSILAKAVARKARRENLEGGEGNRRLLRNRKKIKNKSALCGVLLEDGEANSFLTFVSRMV